MSPQRDPYAGAGTLQLSERQIAILMEPVDPERVAIRPDGLVYLPWIWYADKFDRAFGPGAWALVPLMKPQSQGRYVYVHYAMYVCGAFVGEALGEQQFRLGPHELTLPTACEGAVSDAITRLGKRLGIARSLWDRAWVEEWRGKHAVRAWITDRQEYQWRRVDDPPLRGEGKQGYSGESEYRHGQKLEDENQEHIDSIASDAEEI